MKLLRLCLLCVILGCSFVGKNRVSPQGTVNTVEGQVIRPEVFQHGKVVRIVPFSPGIRVAASEEVGRSAVVMVRGMIDGLNSGKVHFQILDANDREEPELIIKGHIQRLETCGGWERYVGGKRRHFVEVKGKVYDRAGEVAALFHHRVQASYQEMPLRDVMLKVGRDIGEFLVSEK